jgi:hypothetical protein
MIPAFDAVSGNLPPGIHEATWGELVARYGVTPHRVRLLTGLKEALDALKTSGCRRVYVDGSFVTAKDDPADFDGCWEAAGVNPDLLHPVLLDFSGRRSAQKARYGGEYFVAHAPADRLGNRFVDFFQRDKVTGEPKGIIAIDLGDLP